MAKVGRPPSVNKKAPPGKKWCPKCTQFRWLAEFKGKDNYCMECRSEYNKQYKAERIGEPVAIFFVETDITCQCGSINNISSTENFNSGTWTCYNCDQQWSGSVSVEMRYGTSGSVRTGTTLDSQFVAGSPEGFTANTVSGEVLGDRDTGQGSLQGSDGDSEEVEGRGLPKE
ncbi:MAG: hypothetical protein ACXABY_31680 [Candidatus Thorarchaeota archaeon]|jgi:hypothetical protein